MKIEKDNEDRNIVLFLLDDNLDKFISVLNLVCTSPVFIDDFPTFNRLNDNYLILKNTIEKLLKNNADSIKDIKLENLFIPEGLSPEIISEFETEWDSLHRLLKSYWNIIHKEYLLCGHEFQRFDPFIKIFEEIDQDLSDYKKFSQNSADEYTKKFVHNVKKLQPQETKGKLTIFEDGRVEFITPNGERLRAKFKLNSNPYNTLKLLAKNQRKVYTFDEIAETFRKEPKYSEERSARDAVSEVCKKLKLKDRKMLFIVDFGFGIDCDVEFKE